MDKNFIGERISELRLKKNVSEYQMSLDLGKNKSYIQSLTSGRSLPTMQSFLDICDYLEVTPQQLRAGRRGAGGRRGGAAQSSSD